MISECHQTLGKIDPDTLAAFELVLSCFVVGQDKLAPKEK